MAAMCQDHATPEIYTPKSALQTRPMRVEVINATTMRDIETGSIYRLYGVDACELSQTASLARQKWPCGVVATAWLVNATLNKWIACTPIRVEALTQVARCATGEYPDIAAEMLKTGTVITTNSTQDQLIPSYKQNEADARKAYKGVWGSQFQMPWDYRSSQNTSLPE